MWSAIEFKVFAVLIFAVGVWSDCREVDWSDSFNTLGLSQCDRVGDIIQGFCRSDYVPTSDYLGRLESAVCCTKPSPWAESLAFRIANWWNMFKPNSSVECPVGHFLTGLFRSYGTKIIALAEGRCARAKDYPPRYGYCYYQDISTCFDHTGCCLCKNGTFVMGLYRRECDDLYCINKLHCCSFLEPNKL
ncbi:uncharacterized protein LOC131941653 isoform X1 [Physella acuta]|uniref:uncharacterized protein LOC131941653 isoform X1 n=1 Tax=Physella acuta TaxID=109671 RepID=UPI0027DDEE8A|nr:uncharacterized protein LOC131941653 isoform X1 [Physella acuta]XP_059157017.1 uncharacterized protein LOC131941653 isoform X1 [Physella acuta]